MTSKDRRASAKLTPTQSRAARRARRHKRKRILRTAAFGVVGIFALLFIVALFAPGLPISIGGGGGPDGPGERFADEGQTHINPGDDHPAYSSVPATSGWHYDQPFAPSPWGVFTQSLEDEVLVHNLEHGGVVVNYNCPDGCPVLVSQLSELLSPYGKYVLSPYPGMDATIALRAWTFLDKFDEFDEERILAFVDAHMGSPNAPEAFAQ